MDYQSFLKEQEDIKIKVKMKSIKKLFQNIANFPDTRGRFFWQEILILAIVMRLIVLLSRNLIY